MCLIVFAHDVGEHVLVFAANRDEFHARATAPAHAWQDAPHVFGGRDLEKGGTWLGFARTGRLSAVTNVRKWPPLVAPRSRGVLCADFVRGDVDAVSYARSIDPVRAEYADFNLLVHDGRTMAYVSGATSEPMIVGPGVHGLSNAALDVRWPKVVRATDAMPAALDGPTDACSSKNARSLRKESAPASCAWSSSRLVRSLRESNAQ